MRAQPRPSKIVGEAFRDFCHWQAAGIGAHNRPRLADGFDLLQQCPLDLEVLHHGFDNPVHLAHALEIVFEVPDRDQSGETRFEESGRLRFLRRFMSGGSNFVASGSFRSRRNNVQQIAGNSRVSKVGSDTCAHGSGAKNGNFMNMFHGYSRKVFRILRILCAKEGSASKRLLGKSIDCPLIFASPNHNDLRF